MAKANQHDTGDVEGTRQLGDGPDPQPQAPLPSEVVPTAAEVRAADAALQADDDARHEAAADFEAQQLRDRDAYWAEGATKPKRAEDFLPEDKVPPVETIVH